MRLTCVYSLLMFVLFILILFMAQRSMEWAVTSEQARELSDVARSVAETESMLMQNGVYVDGGELGKRERMFFYTYDNEGRLQNFSKAPERFETDVLDVIKTGGIPYDDVAIYIQHQDNAKPSVLMMTACDVKLSSGEILGTVFLGKDVSALYKGIRKSMYTLGGISFLALLVAIFLGHKLAGRVMKPMEKAYERQRQFAADASHELRTPLSVVMASADLLANDPSIQSPFLKQVIDDVKDEVKKMSKLVGDLLQVARSENNAEKLQIKEFDIDDVIGQVIRTMQPLAEKKNIELRGSESGRTPYRGDEQKIKQLVLILVDNAIKYTPEGGTVEVVYGGSSNRVGFSVKDTGIGIALEDQESIFERFFRVDKARSRAMGGNGLGLAIAKDIVDAHRGQIYIKSELGKGTTFTVELKRL